MGPVAFDQWQANPVVAHRLATDAARVTAGPQVNLMGEGGVGNGVDNDSAAIAKTILRAPNGATFRAPAGKYLMDSETFRLFSKLTLVGDGCESTTFTLINDTDSAAIAIEATGGSGRDAYGTRINGIGIDLSNAPSATGIRVGQDNGNGLTGNWAHLNDILVEGGKVSFDCQAVNTHISNYHFINPSQSFIVIRPTGQEFSADGRGILEVSPGVTVPIAIDIPILTGGPAGAVYLTGTRLNNVGTVNRGIYIHCPNGSTASVPLRCLWVVLDNLNGPGYDMENVTDAMIVAGWVNAAGGTGNGAIRFYGGGNHTIMGQQQLNGGVGSACTYDWAGGTTTSVALIGNSPNTGVIHRLPGSGKPLNLDIRDLITSAAALGNITNDVPGLRAAMANDWTPPRHVQPLYVRETGTDPPAGYFVMPAGSALVVAHGGITPYTRVKVTMERPTALATPESLWSSVVDNNPGVSFMVRSSHAASVAAGYWEVYEPV